MARIKFSSPYLLCFFIPALANLALGAVLHPWSQLLTDQLADPDSWMRLLRIRQGVQTGWLLNTVTGLGIGHPITLEWSRLYDFVLVGLTLTIGAPLLLFVQFMTALQIIGLAATPLWSGLFGLGGAYAVRSLVRPERLWLIGLALAVIPGCFMLNSFGSIQYHEFILVPLVWSIGLTLHAARRGISESNKVIWDFKLGGLAAAASIWAMPEIWPFVLCIYAALAWAAASPYGPEPGSRVGVGGVMVWSSWLAVGLMMADLVDPPVGHFAALQAVSLTQAPPDQWRAVQVDRLSFLYVVMGALIWLHSLLLVVLDELRAARRMPRWLSGCPSIVVVPMAAGAIAMLVWLTMYPELISGPWGVMDPADFKIFFATTHEGQPVNTIWDAAGVIAPGLWTVILCCVRLRQARQRQDWSVCGAWIALLAAILFATALACRFLLFQEFPAVIGAVCLPLVLELAWPHTKSLRSFAARLALSCLPFLPFLTLIGGSIAHPVAAASTATGKSCTVTSSLISLLDSASPGSVVTLTPLDQVPELLYKTRIIAVGGLYQHDVPGFMALRQAWDAPVGGKTPPAEITKAHISQVLFCGGQNDLDKTATGQRLYTALRAGTPPSWLQLRGANRAWRLYRVN
jgi:hypothetical protein